MDLATVVPPYVAKPLELLPFRAVMLSPTRVGDPASARALARPYRDVAARLTQWIASNQGAGDVVALEEGIIVQFKAQANNFVNLLDQGAGELQGNFLPWKWEQALTADGQLLGLGTDVGSMAMCYRRDLFEKAGLPTERDQVSALWPDWDQFIATGNLPSFLDQFIVQGLIKPGEPYL